MPSLPLEVKIGRGPSQMMEKIQGWETKTMIHLFRFKRNKEETWVDICKNPDTTFDPRCQSGPSVRNSFDPI